MTETRELMVQQDSVVASLMKASSALAQAKTIQQTKKIMDVAAAAEIYAKRQQLGEEAVSIATSIKLEALRKLGEMLQATPRNTGQISRGTFLVPRGNEPTLEQLGLDKKTSAVAQKLATLSESAFEQVREGNETVAHAIAAISEKKTKQPLTHSPQPQPETPPEEPEYTELDEAKDTIIELQNALVVQNMDGSEEDKAQAKELIERLRAEIKMLRASEAALKVSRDNFQAQVAELKKQIQRQRREIDKLTGGKTA